jgi:hypothetical protein
MPHSITPSSEAAAAWLMDVLACTPAAPLLVVALVAPPLSLFEAAEGPVFELELFLVGPVTDATLVPTTPQAAE